MSTPDLFDDGREAHKRRPRRVLRVSEVNRGTKLYLENRFPDLEVEGELSDLTHARSGHVYFTLNDQRQPAQLQVVMFRSDAQRSRAKLERGAVVRVRGKLSVYEPRGGFQLIARSAIPAGEGDLAAQLERIRKRLEAAGLLDPARKRPLPRFPSVVGVVTSADGAALHDIVRVARSRCPVRVVVADCRVQGNEAPASIVDALTRLQKLPDLEVVIVGRGGGSEEDLWAFNTETVARAIAACRVPTVSAVGHEIDVAISDLVADVRAATPSNAAELVVPDRDALRAELRSQARDLSRALETHLGRARLRIERQTSSLVDPRKGMAVAREALVTHHGSLERRARRAIRGGRARLRDLERRLAQHDPRRKLAADRARLAATKGRLVPLRDELTALRRVALQEQTDAIMRSIGSILSSDRERLTVGAARLDAMSPLKVLGRGYSITLHGEPPRALLRARDARAGDRLELVLHEGRLVARVEDEAGERSR